MNIIQADTLKNLLLMKLEGNLSDEDTRHLSNQAVFEAKKLKRGFTIIEDVSQFSESSSSAKKDLHKTEYEISKLGIGKMIRIVRDAPSNPPEYRVDCPVKEVRSMGEAVRLI